MWMLRLGKKPLVFKDQKLQGVFHKTSSPKSKGWLFRNH